MKEVWLPILRLLVVSNKWNCPLPALLDSGAGLSLFGTSYADALGIDWRNCPQQSIVGVGGEAPGYAADLKLVIPEATFARPARVIFSPALDRMPYALLGHAGFFEHFEVRFKTGARSFRINLK